MEHLHGLFIEAGTLMLAGMVFVFGFLGLLVIFIKTVLAKLAVKFPDAVITQKNQPKAKRSLNKNESPVKGVSPQVVAAITSAVSQYRQQHASSNSSINNQTKK